MKNKIVLITYRSMTLYLGPPKTGSLIRGLQESENKEKNFHVVNISYITSITG